MDNKKIISHKEYGEENRIRIDIDSIPDYVKIELATAALEAVTNFLKQPGGREFLDKQIAKKRDNEEKTAAIIMQKAHQLR